MNSLPDFEPGYIRCTVKPLEHRGPLDTKGSAPEPQVSFYLTPSVASAHNYVCRALALKLFRRKEGDGNTACERLSFLGWRHCSGEEGAGKGVRTGVGAGVACLGDGLHSRGFHRTLAAEAKNAYQADLWRQTAFTFAADKLGWRQKVGEKGEIHCLGRGAHGLVGRARMAMTRSDMRTGCLPSSSEDAHLKCDSGAARGKCNLDIPHWNLSLSDATRAEVGYSDQGRFI